MNGRSAKAAARLWVVEMRVGRRWMPTCIAELTRASGRVHLAVSRDWSPDDEFRLAIYVRAKAAARPAKGAA